MYEKMLAQSEADLKSLKREQEFLIGSVLYFTTFLRFADNDPETIEDATNEITSYLLKTLEAVSSEYEIMDAVNRYLYKLCTDVEAFKGFETSEEYTLFKEIFDLLRETYPNRLAEYSWYIRNYKSYVEIGRISRGYKIISKRKHINKEGYEKILSTIPKV